MSHIQPPTKPRNETICIRPILFTVTEMKRKFTVKHKTLMIYYKVHIADFCIALTFCV